MEAPASAIDEGRRGGRSERSDSGRKGKGKGAEREKERVAVLFVRAEREEQCQCSCRSLLTSLHCCWPYSDGKQTPPPGQSARRASKEPRGTFGLCVSHVGRTDACFRIRNISFLGNPDRIWTGAASLR